MPWIVSVDIKEEGKRHLKGQNQDLYLESLSSACLGLPGGFSRLVRGRQAFAKFRLRA
jgi:hypothetical protein